MAIAVLEHQIHDLIVNVWDFPTLQVLIDIEEVQRQYEKHPNTHQFTEVVSEMMNSFLRQMESSESPRDIISLQKDIQLDDKMAITKAMQEAVSVGALYLFPYDYEAVLKQHQLPFGKKDLVRTIEDNWLFGFISSALPDWYFIGFVNRRDIADTYNTGFKKNPISA